MKGENVELQIPSEVLKTLRETSGYSVEEIAKKLKTAEEKIKAVEEGKSSFTIIQIKKLADVYHRPLAAFFEPSLPKPQYALTDYRINREKKLPSEIYLAERRAFYLASKVAELSGKKSDIPDLPERLKGNVLANEFRKYLNVQPPRNEKPENILNHYKNILEEKLQISIIEYPLKADDVRAFCISTDLSAVVLNESDEAKIKLFSLFHEICHLLRRNSAICSIEIESDQRIPEVEWDCDLFAAEFLVPEEDLKLEINKIPTAGWDSISALSDTYGVSKQVVMLRLLRLGYIKQEAYTKFKNNLNIERLKKRKFGRRSWDKVFHNRVGELAIREIKNSYHKGDISFSEVINVMSMKTKYAEKFMS